MMNQKRFMKNLELIAEPSIRTTNRILYNWGLGLALFTIVYVQYRRGVDFNISRIRG